MISRTTHRSTAMTSLANLQAGQARTAKLQEQLTTGRSLTKASDDPVATGQALRHRTDLALNEQYGRSIGDGQAWLAVQESALTSTTDALRRAKGLALQAASTGNHDQTARNAIAVQIEGIRQDVLAAANTTYRGRAVFAGTADVSGAYDPATGAYLGDAGQVQRRVAPGVDVAVNVLGSDAFGSGGTPTGDTLASLEALAVAVRAGDTATTSAQLDNLDAGLTRLLGALGTVGARVNQLDGHEQAAQARGDALITALDEVEGVDIAKAMIEYRLQETAYQAALAATAKTIQPTLLDFLR